MADCTVVGGKLYPNIQMTIKGVAPVPVEQITQQVATAAAQNYPGVEQIRADKRRVAIVGGGPSIAKQLEDLRNFDGELWAVNGAWQYLGDNGIDATFVAVDPDIIVARWAANVSGRAFVASRCHPAVFDALEANSADFKVFVLEPDGGPIKTASSTATAAAHLAFTFGFAELVFYGCESSYEFNQSHAYMHEMREQELIVRCYGNDYLTAPDYMLQACEMAVMIRTHPQLCKEESGGLLRAIIKSRGNYRIIWISKELGESLKLEALQMEDGSLVPQSGGSLEPQDAQAAA